MGQYTIKDIESRAEALKNDVDNIYRALNDKLGSSPETLDQVPEYILSIPDLPTEEPLTITPTIDGQEISTFDDLKYNPITVEPVTSAIDSNIQPENIKEGVSILGVAGTLSEGSGGDTPDYRYAKGTVDKAGLRAIGWTDEDILTFEQNKTPHYVWQNDQFKVSDENKALYLLDDPKPDSYKSNPNITFVPKKNMESYFTKAQGFMDMKYIKGIPFFDTSSATNLTYLFQNCSSLTTIPHLDFSRITVTTGLFYGCSGLTTIPLIDISKVTDASYMFYGCNSLTSIPSIDTSSVTNAAYMFGSCSGLTSIPSINTSNVTNTTSMFHACSKLTAIPFLDMSKVTNASSMFYQCSSLITIPSIDISKVTDVSSMFQNCSNLAAIPQLDTSNVTDMTQIFTNCTKLVSVEGIDFSGLTSSPSRLFGYNSNMSNIKRFIVNGKINVSMSDNYNIKPLTAIDYDSVKSILAAADRTDNTNAKTLAFNRTIADQNGELAALVASCSTKGWTITGLTLQ